MGDSMLDQIRNKVQRLLTKNFNVRLGEDNEWIITYGSASVWVEVDSFEGPEGELGHITLTVPLVHDVKFTPEVHKWVALEGHQFKFGTVCAYEYTDKPGLGNLMMEYSLFGADVDESELCTAVGLLAISGDKLDTDLNKKFGGEMFGKD